MSLSETAPSAYLSASALLRTGVRLSYHCAGDGDDVVVLLHGWPQTAWQWRLVAPRLVAAGYRVVAPDLRGAGHSSRPRRDDGVPADPRGAGLPRGGYDKVSVAEDVHALLTDELGVTAPVAVVGHDIGAMVAVAYALRHRHGVRALAFGEAPVPGTGAYEQLKTSAAMYHFAFHSQLDLPEALVTGREEIYLQHFFDRLGYAPETIDTAYYARAYAQAGALRAGFDLYRAFETDSADNRAALREDGRISAPTLAYAGETSPFTEVIEEMAREVADDVRVATVPRSGHWMAEENPEGFTEMLVGFLDRVHASAAR